MKDLNAEIYKTLIVETKDDAKEMERFPILLTGRVNIVKMPKLSTVQHNHQALHLKITQYCKSLYFNFRKSHNCKQCRANNLTSTPLTKPQQTGNRGDSLNLIKHMYEKPTT